MSKASRAKVGALIKLVALAELLAAVGLEVASAGREKLVAIAQ